MKKGKSLVCTSPCYRYFLCGHTGAQNRQSTNVAYTEDVITSILWNGCSFMISEMLETERFRILV